jgi:outer membrane protein
MRLRGLTLAAYLALGVAACQHQAFALTLEDAISQALQHNADVKVAAARRDMADAQLRQARAGQYPSVAVSGEIATARTDLGGFFGFGEQTTTPRVAQITLEQPLLAPGVFANVDRAKAGQTLANKAALAARLGLAATVAEAYVAVQAAEERQSLFTIALQQMQLVDREAGLLFEKGGISRTELSRTKARIAEVRAELARAESNMVQARTHFATIVGLPPDGLSPIETVPALPATADEAVAIAVANSPALGMARSKLDAADAALRAARAERWPTVSAVAEAGTMRDQFFPGYRTNDLRVGVRGRVSIFSGGLVSGKIAEADAARRAAAAELDGAKESLNENVATGWQIVRSTVAMRDATTEAAKSADMAYSDARAEHKVGARSTAEVLDTQRDSVSANLNRIMAVGDTVVSVYRLRAVIGSE